MKNIALLFNAPDKIANRYKRRLLDVADRSLPLPNKDDAALIPSDPFYIGY
jgi:hypothetical protein